MIIPHILSLMGARRVNCANISVQYQHLHQLMAPIPV